jgi:hypothetical protein
MSLRKRAPAKLVLGNDCDTTCSVSKPVHVPPDDRSRGSAHSRGDADAPARHAHPSRRQYPNLSRACRRIAVWNEFRGFSIRDA